MTGSTPLRRSQLEAIVIDKAQQDNEFKQKLLRQPTETILREMELPYGKHFASWAEIG